MITTNDHGRCVDTLRDEPTARTLRPFATDYGIEGPDLDDGFVRQDSVLRCIARAALPYALFLAIVALVLGFAALRVGIF